MLPQVDMSLNALPGAIEPPRAIELLEEFQSQGRGRGNYQFKFLLLAVEDCRNFRTLLCGG